MEAILARIDKSKSLSQCIPIFLTIIILGILLTILHESIALLNQMPGAVPILFVIRPQDVLVGATIYLKTEIDFAILIGRLMEQYPGWRNRIALEIGSAVGNASGTILIIGIWVILKHVDMLLALMVFVASLVLFELAASGMDYLKDWKVSGGVKKVLFIILRKLLDSIGIVTNPLLSRIIPDLGERLRGKEGLTWKQLAVFSTEIPFILGLDDFAGYVPLFSIINVYGFAVGVIAAHTALNLSLFLSPRRTIAVVKNEFITALGTIAFIGLAIYGLLESVRLFLSAF